jgi:dTDP-4-dehydrorhamnose 3,5-epimerase
MRITATPLSGLVTIDTQSHEDSRGRFERIFCEAALREVRPGLRFVQVNLSTTALRGTVRGMHFQRTPSAEAKLIKCLRGCVFDVAVDLRADSPTFLRWHGMELRGDEPREVFIPEGFAHGFQSLSDDAQLLYFHTQPWTPSCEGGVRHDDPRLAIKWPLPLAHISERDLGHPLIDGKFEGLD